MPSTVEQRQQTPQAQWVTHSARGTYLVGCRQRSQCWNHSQCCDDSCRSARVLTRGCMVQQINLATCYKLGIGLEQVQRYCGSCTIRCLLYYWSTAHPSVLGTACRRRIDEVSRAQPCQPLRLPCLRTHVLHADTNAHTKSHTHAHKHTHARTHITHECVGCGFPRILRQRPSSSSSPLLKATRSRRQTERNRKLKA